MKRIRMVLDRELFRAINRAVRKLRTSRSSLVRDALKRHLQRLDRIEREKADRDGFARNPETFDREWDTLAAWPGK